MWNMFELRAGLVWGDNMFVGDDAVWLAGMHFGSQTWVLPQNNLTEFSRNEVSQASPHTYRHQNPLRVRQLRDYIQIPPNTDYVTLDKLLNLSECLLQNGDSNYLIELSRGFHELM